MVVLKDSFLKITIYAYEMLVDVFEADVLEIEFRLTADKVLIFLNDFRP